MDEQLDARLVLRPLRKWITVERLPDLRPNEQVLDDRVPEILRTLKQPTFVTIDLGGRLGMIPFFSNPDPSARLSRRELLWAVGLSALGLASANLARIRAAPKVPWVGEPEQGPPSEGPKAPLPRHRTLVFSAKTWNGEYVSKDIPGGVEATPGVGTLYTSDAFGAGQGLPAVDRKAARRRTRDAYPRPSRLLRATIHPRRQNDRVPSVRSACCSSVRRTKAVLRISQLLAGVIH